MKTITIETNNSNTLRLIEDMAKLDLLRIIGKDISKNKRKLSEKLTGSISKKSAVKMTKELHQMRNEWNRNI